MGSSFIPYANHNIIEGYSMTSSFTNFPGLDTIGGKYENYLSGLVSGGSIPNQHAIGKAISNLQIYVTKERAAEIAFLNEVGAILGINIQDNTATWKNLIEGFNKILGTEAVLKRNVAQLKQIYSKETKQRSGDVSRRLGETYLPKAILEALPIKSVSQLTDSFVLKIMKRAVELMYSASDKIENTDDAKEIQCYKEIWDALSQLSHQNSLFVNLANSFNLKNFLTDNLQKINSATKQKDIRLTATQKNSPGQLLEQLEVGVLNQLAKTRQLGISSGDLKLLINFIPTGATQQKADTFGIVMATGSINYKDIMTGGPTRKDKSYRLRSIERIENLLKQIGNKKAQLTFISDKNYEIGAGSFHAKHGGFKAESPTLSSLGMYGAKFHIPNVTNMIEYLASAGPGMIVEDVDMCLEVIKNSIGNFLFDDLQITGPVNSGANRVHILNLGGTYMPASVYLEATLQALRGVGNLTADDMVQVEFEPRGSAGSSTKENWDNFHTERLKSIINIHFLGGYEKFMSQVFS